MAARQHQGNSGETQHIFSTANWFEEEPPLSISSISDSKNDHSYHPTISLMDDQISALQAKGIRATHLGSTQDTER